MIARLFRLLAPSAVRTSADRPRRALSIGSVECLETRIAPATLDLTGGVLTFTLDADASDAALSAAGGYLTFDAGTGHTITLTGDAASNGFVDGGQTSTGAALAGLEALGVEITQINIVGSTGTETFRLQSINDEIAGLDLAATVESVLIDSANLHTRDIATNAIVIGGAVTLLGDVEISTVGAVYQGAVTLAGPIDSPTGAELSVEAGSATVSLGAVTDLGVLDVTAATIVLGGDLTVGGNLTLHATGSTLELGNVALSTVSGGALTLSGLGITQGATGRLQTSDNSVLNIPAGGITLNGGGSGIDLLGSIESGHDSASAVLLTNATTVKLGSITAQGGSSAGITISTVTGLLEQNFGTAISTRHFSASTSDDIDLSNAGNDFSGPVTLATTLGRTITLVDLDALTLGDVTFPDGTLTVSAVSLAVTGTVSGGTTATLTATGAIALSGPLNVAGLTLNAGTTITQSAGGIVTELLTTSSTGSQTLTAGANVIEEFTATNAGAGSAIALRNGYDGFVIGAVTTAGGAITIQNLDGGAADAAIVSGAVSSGGGAAGDITIATTGGLTVDGALDTAGGSGGRLVLSGGITLNTAPVLGGGDVNLQGGDGDLLILDDVSFATSTILASQRNIVIGASLATLGALSDLTLRADSDEDGSGGVWIQTDGFVSAGRDLAIHGSALTSDLVADSNQGVRIAADGGVAQIQAVRNITIGTSEPDRHIALGGLVQTTNSGSTIGNIRFAGPVVITDDTAAVQAAASGSITFEATVDSALGGFDLRLQSAFGNINFDGAVGGGLELGELEIVNAYQVNATATIEVQRFMVQHALSTVTLGDVVTAGAADDISIFIHAPSLNLAGAAAPGGGGIVLEVDALALTAEVSGTGALEILPMSIGRSIGLAGVGGLNLDATEIGHLAAGFESITIGRSNGTGVVTIGTAGAAFHSSVTIQAPAGAGTINVTGPLSTDVSGAGVTLNAANIKLSVGTVSVIETESGAIDLRGAVHLLAPAVFDSRGTSGAGSGDISQTGSINGAFALEVYAGELGTIQFNGREVAGPVGASIGQTALTSLTLSAGTINLKPTVRTTGNQDYTAAEIHLLNGPLLAIGAGSLYFHGTVVSHGANTLSAAKGDIVFEDGIDAASEGVARLQVTATKGSISLDGVIGATHRVAALNLSAKGGTGLISVGAGVTDIAVGTLTLATTGALTLGGLDATGAVNLTAAEIDFIGGPDSVTGPGTLTLQTNGTLQGLRIGGLETEDASALTFSDTDLAALADGFSSIVFKRTAGAAPITLAGGLSFSDPITFQQVVGRGTIEVEGALTASGDGAFTFTGGTATVLGGDVTTAGGNLRFGLVKYGSDRTISSDGGSIVFGSNIISIADFVSPNLSIRADSGDVSIVGSIGVQKNALFPGEIAITTSGITNLGPITAQSFTADGGGLTILRGAITARAEAGLAFVQVSDDVELRGAATITARNGGDITFSGDINSQAGKNWGLTLISQPTNKHEPSGSITIGGDLGAAGPLGGLVALAVGADHSGAISFNGEVQAKAVKLTGSEIYVGGAVTTPTSQAYKGLSIELNGALTAASLSFDTREAIANDQLWTITGKATLITPGSITLANNGSTFGSLALTGISATVATAGNIVIAGGKVAGLTELTSVNGSIWQTGVFSTGTLAAEALADGAFINFATHGVNLLTLGAIHADGDISIVRSGNRALVIDEQIISDAGDILIVANHGGTTGNLINAAGSTPLQAAGRILLYAFDRSVTVAPAPFASFGVDIHSSYLRYSADASKLGHPSRINGGLGDLIVFARL